MNNSLSIGIAMFSFFVWGTIVARVTKGNKVASESIGLAAIIAAVATYFLLRGL